jgi:hypothetical protein
MEAGVQCWQHVRGKTAPLGRASGFVRRHGSSFEGAVAAGAAREDLSQIARGVQVELLSQLCYMLEDNGLSEPELKGGGWGFFQSDEEGNPLSYVEV